MSLSQISFTIISLVFITTISLSTCTYDEINSKQQSGIVDINR